MFTRGQNVRKIDYCCNEVWWLLAFPTLFQYIGVTLFIQYLENMSMNAQNTKSHREFQGVIVRPEFTFIVSDWKIPWKKEKRLIKLTKGKSW